MILNEFLYVFDNFHLISKAKQLSYGEVFFNVMFSRPFIPPAPKPKMVPTPVAGIAMIVTVTFITNITC